MRKKRRRGRPAKYVLDRNGKPIVGLSCDGNGYYNTHYRSEEIPRNHFGATDDFNKAVIRFKRWRDKREKKTHRVKITETSQKQNLLNQIYQRILYNKDGQAEWDAIIEGKEYVDPDVIFDLEEEFLWDVARYLIASTPPSVVAENLTRLRRGLFDLSV